MPNWSGYTLSQVRAATKTQIINAITNYLNGLTKRQIIALLWDVAEDGWIGDDRLSNWRPDGQPSAHLDVRRDPLGTKVGSTAAVFTYNPDNTADSVVVVDYDANDVPLRRRTIRYRYDGKQPDVTVET